jgi:hypothetical protein
MTQDAIPALAQLLAKFEPPWVAIILAVVILCYRLPDIVRAFRSKR